MEKRKRGGQPGNKNAVGHGAPKGNQNAVGHGAPWGNCNALRHGRYSIFRDGRNHDLYLAALNYMDKHHIEMTRANMEICAGILQDMRTMRQGANFKHVWDRLLQRLFHDFVQTVGGNPK